MDELRLDGNSASGTLREIFPFEITTTQVTCNACQATGLFGALATYVTNMGMVIRCQHCDNMMLRVTHIKGRYLLDMRGIGVMQIAMG
jgi:hypothetical protein